MKTKGFTLVELLVVIAILAILATVSVVGYTSFIDRANESNAQTEADQVKSIITNGLLADDFVNLNGTIYASEDDGEVVFNATPATGDRVFDASADIAELVANGGVLGTNDDGDLTYTNYGYTVVVMTRESAKAED